MQCTKDLNARQTVQNHATRLRRQPARNTTDSLAAALDMHLQLCRLPRTPCPGLNSAVAVGVACVDLPQTAASTIVYTAAQRAASARATQMHPGPGRHCKVRLQAEQRPRHSVLPFSTRVPFRSQVPHSLMLPSVRCTSHFALQPRKLRQVLPDNTKSQGMTECALYLCLQRTANCSRIAP